MDGWINGGRASSVCFFGCAVDGWGLFFYFFFKLYGGVVLLARRPDETQDRDRQFVIKSTLGNPAGSTFYLSIN